MKRTRLASLNHPIMRQNAPVPMALIMSAPAAVTNSASPCASTVVATEAMTITSAGDNPATTPR